MSKKSSNKWLPYIIGGIIAVIIIGLAIKVLVGKKEEKSSSEQRPSTSLNKLSDQELEKYLLEKRLDLQNYIVFNLGSLTKQWAVDARKHEQWDGINSPYEPNRRVASAPLKEYLSILNRQAGNSGKYPLYSQTTGKIVEWKDIDKSCIVITDKQEKILPSFSATELDKKIVEGQIYIILKKDEIDWKYRYNGQETSEIFVKLDDSNIFPSKKEAVGFLKNNDPALKEI